LFLQSFSPLEVAFVEVQNLVDVTLDVFGGCLGAELGADIVVHLQNSLLSTCAFEQLAVNLRTFMRELHYERSHEFGFKLVQNFLGEDSLGHGTSGDGCNGVAEHIFGLAFLRDGVGKSYDA